MPHSPGSVDDGYFNDLSRQPHSGSRESDSPHEVGGHNDEGGAPRTKRIACVICRRRKLKCDGVKPKCATCARLGHDCQYDEVRRKSGPKRGYVKDLEARLAQVETQLNKTKDTKKARPNGVKDLPSDTSNVTPQPFANFQPGAPADMAPPAVDRNQDFRRQHSIPEGREYSPAPNTNDPLMMPMTSMAPDIMADPQMINNLDLSLDANFSWEMIGLGLEEPMPMQEAIDELTDIYFEKIHPSLPILHKYRYRASMNFAPERRPPICLRYIMWAHAAAITDKYMHHHDIFYKRARKYIEMDELKGQGEAFITLPHAQTWSLVAIYEFKMMYFPRAWMSVGRATRLVLMMGLNRIDGVGLDVKQTLPTPRDWTEREERRRTFWMAYCIDRYASIGTGWPMNVDERDIMTFLPASEEAFESGTPQKAPTLGDAITPAQVSQLSSFAGVVFVTHFFGLNLTHLHRPEPNQREDDLNGEFWKRHHVMDNNLTQTAILLPSHLRLPTGARNPNIVFLNFSIHASTICLHQAAIFKAEKHHLPNSIVEKSRDRCLAAANAIEDVMRQTCHFDVAGMNPFMAFCLYVAARVFVQYLKKNPHDGQTRTALQFLLTAMEAMKLKNPLTESFLVQLHLDIKGNGLDVFFHNPDYLSSTFSDGQIEQNSNGEKSLFAGYENHKCKSTVNVSDSVSEGRSPEDLRFPETDSDTLKKTPSIRTESPRQTQYAFRNIDLMAREARNVRPFYPNAQHEPNQQLHGIFSAKSWSGGNINNGPNGLSPAMNNNNGLNGLSPAINNNNLNVTGFDTEMSDPQNNSTGLTPQSNYSYNQSSSNTDYSTPNMQDEDSATNQATNTPSIAGPMNGYTSFSPPSDQTYSTQRSGSGSGSVRSPAINIQQTYGGNAQLSNGVGQNDLFKSMQGWDVPNGSTPGSMQGMSSGGDWAKMMESMEQGIGWGVTPGGEGN